jgi:hypothetical protein
MCYFKHIATVTDFSLARKVNIPALSMKSTFFLGVKQCNLAYTFNRFRRIYRLSLRAYTSVLFSKTLVDSYQHKRGHIRDNNIIR